MTTNYHTFQDYIKANLKIEFRLLVDDPRLSEIASKLAHDYSKSKEFADFCKGEPVNFIMNMTKNLYPLAIEIIKANAK
jgi:hypothetical protein